MSLLQKSLPMTFIELNLQTNEKSKKYPKPTNRMASILHQQHNSNSHSHGGDGKLMDYSKSKLSTNGRATKSRLSHPRISFSKNMFKGSIFIEGLTQTTLSFCRETTLHGMKYIVDDIEELGSTFSK